MLCGNEIFGMLAILSHCTLVARAGVEIVFRRTPGV